MRFLRLNIVKEESLLFGKIVLNNHLATEEQVKECLALEEKYLKEGISKPLADIFVEKGYLSKKQAQKVMEAQQLSIRLRNDSLLGKLAIKNHLMKPEQVQECLDYQKQIGYSKRIGEIFLEKGYLSDKHYRALLQAQERILSAQKAKERGGFTDIVNKKEIRQKVNPSPSTQEAPSSSPQTATTTSIKEPSSGDSQKAFSPTELDDENLTYEELFVKKALEYGFITPSQVEECKEIQKKIASMGIEKGLDQIIVDKKYLDSEQQKKIIS
ncbi:MAG: hypothetical protein D6785_11710, partial [Planctomycetota bacterium]